MQKAAESVLQAETAAANMARARDLLEVEKQRVNQLLTILSDFSTQATLLAGCAVAALGVESLHEVDTDDHGFAWLYGFGELLYVGSTALSAGSSLWVVFIATHLITLGRDSAMRPRIKQNRGHLESGLGTVRGMLWLSIGSLVFSCLIGIYLNMSPACSAVASLILFLVVWQALLMQKLVSEKFAVNVGESDSKLACDLSVGEFLRSWLEPFDSSPTWQAVRPSASAIMDRLSRRSGSRGASRGAVRLSDEDSVVH